MSRKKVRQDEFAELVNSFSQGEEENPLADSFPSAGTAESEFKMTEFDPDRYTYECHYLRVDLSVQPQTALLEEVMNKALRGEVMIASERFCDTKDGNTFSVVKYFIPRKKAPSAASAIAPSPL